MQQSYRELWLWTHTDDAGKRRTTRYPMKEADALAHLKNPEKVAGSLERVLPNDSTSSWLKGSYRES